MEKTDYQTAGIFALLIPIASFLWEFNFLVSSLMVVVISPYIFIKLRALLIERTQYKQLFTAVIYFIILTTILAPIFVLIGYYGGISPLIFLRGLGYIALGWLLLMERRKYNILMKSIAIVALFLGGTHIHTSLYTIYPNLLLVMTVKSLELYRLIKVGTLFVLYILLGINFLWTHKKEYNKSSIEQ